MTQPEEHEAAEARPEVHASLLSSTEGCPNCGAPFAADQRYCIECGERLGTSDMPSARPAPAAAAAEPGASRRIRMSPNATLIAGVGTLLLALGIGVLIGRSGNPSTKTGSVQVVSVPGAAAAGSAAGASTTAAAATTGSSSTKSAGHKGSKGKTSTSGSKVPKAPVKVVKVGQTKGSGPGYDKKTHKFTGNFFGQ